jgi:hypothetical protein
MSIRNLIGTLAAGVALLIAPTNAAADTLLFDQAGAAGGTVSYAGGAAPATGSGISFTSITYVEGASSVACVGCVLTFTTGANTLNVPGVVYTWGGGGSFVITGSVPLAGIGAGSTLLSGTFSGPVPAIASMGAGGKLTLSGTGIDSKNSALLQYFGLADSPFIFASTNITAVGCAPDTTTGAFSCTVDEADVTNDNRAVPEPGLLTLFGLGLLGLGSVARRRLAARQ